MVSREYQMWLLSCILYMYSWYNPINCKSYICFKSFYFEDKILKLVKILITEKLFSLRKEIRNSFQVTKSSQELFRNTSHNFINEIIVYHTQDSSYRIHINAKCHLPWILLFIITVKVLKQKHLSKTHKFKYMKRSALILIQLFSSKVSFLAENHGLVELEYRIFLVEYRYF